MMKPGTEAELAEMIAGATGPLRVEGGGTRPIGGALQGDILSTKGLSGISLYEPGALTLVAQAGTPLAEIEQVLAAEGQRLAFEPMDHQGLLGTSGEPTIGGVVAGNVSGPRRIQAGACRDALLGVRFVDGAGRVLKNGGRVMKNVTGYDLVKLMAGSWGTLGVLSEVSLKVLPVPETTGVLLFDGLSDSDAVGLMSRALASPFEITGAAHTPFGLDGAPVTMLRIEGFEASVRYRLDALKHVLAGFGAPREETDAENTDKGWHWVRDVEAFSGRSGNVWRLSVKPSDAADLVASIPHKAALFDWGGGLVWLLTLDEVDVRAAMDRVGGHATLVRGAGFPAFQPEPAPLAKITDGLRRRFDPRGFLNPGLMG